MFLDLPKPKPFPELDSETLEKIKKEEEFFDSLTPRDIGQFCNKEHIKEGGLKCDLRNTKKSSWTFTELCLNDEICPIQARLSSKKHI